MRKQDLTLTDIFVSQRYSGGNYVVIEIGGWEHVRFHGPRRIANSQDHLLLNIDPRQRHDPAEPLDESGNEVEGDLIDWFAVAAKVRKDITKMSRLDSQYEKSDHFYRPPFGSLEVGTSRQLTTRAVKEAEAAAERAKLDASRAYREDVEQTRRNRFEAALTGAGIAADGEGVPRYDGRDNLVRVSLNDWEALMAQVAKR